MIKKTDVRIERDKFGEVQVPAAALWGAQTARTQEIYSANGPAVHPHLIDALVLVKKSSALANSSIGKLEQSVAKSIAQAADEILAGQWRDHFVADVFQFSSGVSLISNVDEVLANRATQLLGGSLGTYELVHPQQHVAFGQSSADVFPTAMRVALLLSWRELEPVLLDLERLLRRKSLEFEKVAKVGRAHLQDSPPITLGQEFNAFGSSVERSLRRIKEATNSLHESNLGHSAVGTGYGTDQAFSPKALEQLAVVTGMKFRVAEDVFRVTQSMADFLQFSSTLKELAVELCKIAADLRLLASGPYAGFSEIRIPALQPERSDLAEFLPEKQNPYLTETVTMVCYQVIGNDAIATMCAQSGQLETNSFTPLLIHTILQSLELLKNAIAPFNSRCLAGITADSKRCQQLLELSGASAAAVGVYLGPERAAELFTAAKSGGKTVRELVIEQKLLSPDVVDRILHYKFLTRPGNSPIGGISASTTSSTSTPIDQS